MMEDGAENMARRAHSFLAGTRKGYRQPVIQVSRKVPRVGRNNPCPCGSGKKYKKCCAGVVTHGAAKVFDRPRPKAKRPTTAKKATQAVAMRHRTATALRNAGAAEEIVWAYLQVGKYITQNNRSTHSPGDVKAWDAAIEQYKAADSDAQHAMLAELQ